MLRRLTASADAARGGKPDAPYLPDEGFSRRQEDRFIEPGSAPAHPRRGVAFRREHRRAAGAVDEAPDALVGVPAPAIVTLMLTRIICAPTEGISVQPRRRFRAC